MRPSASRYFMNIANEVATRSTCTRRHVGCVLVDEHNHILATGYNGVPRGMPHCRGGWRCPAASAPSGTQLESCLAVHAEQNALIQLADPFKVAIAFCTVSPCIHCIKMLMNTSCKILVYGEEYPHPRAKKLWTDSGREWLQLEKEK